MSKYIVLGDGRENDCHTIYCYGTLDQCRKKARQMIMHWNKDIFHPKFRKEMEKISDKKFCDRWISAWIRSPSIIRLPCSNKK